MNAELSMLQVMSESRGQAPHRAYRTQQVLSAKPEDLVLMVYDHVIASSRAKDKRKASAGIAVLIDALDFDQGEIALGLFRLYRYTMDKVWEGEFDDVVSVMRPLREAWAAAMRNRAGPTGRSAVLPPPAERVGASAGR
ncbi:MAG: flagellar export chaperone FliS [Bacillota bacterium]